MTNFLKKFQLIILRSVLKKPLRMIFTILASTSGITLFVAIYMVNKTALVSLEKNTQSLMGKTDFSIQSQSGIVPSSLIEKLENLDVVESATGIITKNTSFYKKDGKKSKLSILGIDMLKEQTFRSYEDQDGEDILEDPIEFLNTPNGIILTQKVTSDLGLTYGDQIKLLTSKGKQNFEIGGILRPIGVAEAFGGTFAVMDILAAQHMFRMEDSFSKIDLILNPNFDKETSKKEISKILSQKYQIKDLSAQMEDAKSLTNSFRVLLNTFGIFTWLISLLFVYSSISLSITQKSKEIAILRSLGSTKNGIFSQFLIESSIIGLISGMLAIVLGNFFSGKLSQIIFHSYEAQFRISIKSYDVSFGLSFYLIILIAGLITGLLAGYFPAKSTSKISPIEAIREASNTDQSTSHINFKYFQIFMAIISSSYYGLSFLFGFYKLSPILNVIHALAGLLALIFLISFNHLIWIKFLSLIKSKFPTSMWYGASNIIHNSKMSKEIGLRQILTISFIFILLVFRSSFTRGIKNFFNSRVIDKYVIMSDDDIFSLNIIPFDKNEVNELLKIDNIRKTSSGKIRLGLIQKSIYADKSIHIFAYNDYESEEIFKSLLSIHELSKDFSYKNYNDDNSNQAIVSLNFLSNFQKSIGDTIEIDNFQSGRTQLKIVGSMIDYTDPQGTIHTNIHNYKKIIGNDLISNAFITPLNSKLEEKTIEEIQNFISEKTGLTLINSLHIQKTFFKNIDQSFAFINVIIFIACLVSLIGLLTPQTYHYMIRQREFGIIKSIGMSKFQFMMMTFLENFLIGLISLSYVFSIGTIFIIIFFKTSFLEILKWQVPVSLGLAEFLIPIMILFFITFSTTIFPYFLIRKKSISTLIAFE